MPSPEEAARARAQIGSEVLQWHARRSSRSISLDDGSSTATSEPQSPTTDCVNQAALYGDENWAAAAEALQQQQPTMTSSTVLVFKSPNSH